VAAPLEIPLMATAGTTETPPAASSAVQATVPTVTFGKPEITGRYASPDVERVVKENEAVLRGCYETAAKSNPSLHGRVTVLIQIGKTGDVESAIDHGSPIGDLALVGCVRRAFLSFDFPQPPNGSVLVTCTIDFERAPARLR